MEDCIFCKIALGEIPCAKIWEDDNYLSFLDINPVTEGMALVIPKKHKDSDVFKNDQETINNIMGASKKVSELLKKSLNIERVGVIFEGIEVDHLHVKLIPIKGGEFIKSILNSSYPKPDRTKLENLASKIRSSH
jgi:diadenosine tetraphosphate (Ap4A) HIT family hydrolase